MTLCGSLTVDAAFCTPGAFPFSRSDDQAFVLATARSSLDAFLQNYRSNRTARLRTQYERELVEHLGSPDARAALNAGAVESLGGAPGATTWADVLELLRQHARRPALVAACLRALVPTPEDVAARLAGPVWAALARDDPASAAHVPDAQPLLFDGAGALVGLIVDCLVNADAHAADGAALLAAVLANPFLAGRLDDAARDLAVDTALTLRPRLLPRPQAAVELAFAAAAAIDGTPAAAARCAAFAERAVALASEALAGRSLGAFGAAVPLLTFLAYRWAPLDPACLGRAVAVVAGAVGEHAAHLRDARAAVFELLAVGLGLGLLGGEEAGAADAVLERLLLPLAAEGRLRLRDAASGGGTHAARRTAETACLLVRHAALERPRAVLGMLGAELAGGTTDPAAVGDLAGLVAGAVDALAARGRHTQDEMDAVAAAHSTLLDACETPRGGEAVAEALLATLRHAALHGTPSPLPQSAVARLAAAGDAGARVVALDAVLHGSRVPLQHPTAAVLVVQLATVSLTNTAALQEAARVVATSETPCADAALRALLLGDTLCPQDVAPVFALPAVDDAVSRRRDEAGFETAPPPPSLALRLVASRLRLRVSSGVREAVVGAFLDAALAAAHPSDAAGFRAASRALSRVWAVVSCASERADDASRAVVAGACRLLGVCGARPDEVSVLVRDALAARLGVVEFLCGLGRDDAAVVARLDGVCVLMRGCGAHGALHDGLVDAVCGAAPREAELQSRQRGEGRFETCVTYAPAVLDAAVAAVEALAGCPACRGALPEGLVVGLVVHAARSIPHLARIADALPEHPVVGPLAARLAGDVALWHSPAVAERLVVLLARHAADAALVELCVGYLAETRAEAAPARLALFGRVVFGDQLNSLHVPAVRARVDVAGWAGTETLLSEPFAETAAQQRLASLRFFLRLAAAADDRRLAGRLQARALAAVAGAELGFLADAAARAVAGTRLCAACFEQWHAAHRGLAGIPHGLFAPSLDAFLAANAGALLPLVAADPRAAAALLPRLGCATLDELLAREMDEAVALHVAGTPLRQVGEPRVRRHVAEHTDAVLAALRGRPAFALLVPHLPPTLHPNQVVAFLTGGQLADALPHVAAIHARVAPEHRLLFLQLLLTRAPHEHDVAAAAAPLLAAHLAAHPGDDELHALSISALVAALPPDAPLAKAAAAHLRRLLPDGPTASLVYLLRTNFPDAAPLPAHLASRPPAGVGPLLCILPLDEPHRAALPDQTPALLAAAAALADPTSGASSWLSSQQYPIPSQQPALALQTTLLRRAAYLVATLRGSPAVLAFVRGCADRGVASVGGLLQPVLDAINAGPPPAAGTAQHTHPPDIVALADELVRLVVGGPVADAVHAFCLADTRAAELALSCALQAVPAHHADRARSLLCGDARALASALPFLARHYSGTSPLCAALNVRELVPVALGDRRPYTAWRFAERLRWKAVARRGGYEERRSHDECRGLVAQVAAALGDTETARAARVGADDAADETPRLRLVRADATGGDAACLAAALRECGLHRAASLCSPPSGADVTGVDYAGAWRALQDWGDVAAYDAACLDADADFHLWRALRHEPGALERCEALAFDALREGVAREAPRGELRRLLVDCMLPSMLRSPERAAHTLQRAADAGLSYGDLRRALDALRAADAPGALALTARLGRRWGALDEVYAALVAGRGGGEPTAGWVAEFAKTRYAQGARAEALAFLRHHAQRRPTVELRLLEARWLLETRCEGRDAILGVLGAAEAMLGADAPPELRGRVHYRLARFYDAEADAVAARLASAETARRDALLATYRAQERELAALRARTAEQNRALEAARQAAELYAAERAALPDPAAYAARSIAHYCGALRASRRHDLHALFRAVTLWFHNERAQQVQDAAREHLCGAGRVPAWKLIPLLPQIASRLSDPAAPQQTADAVERLLALVAQEHPHHALYPLCAIANAGAARDGFPRTPPSEVALRILERLRAVGGLQETVVQYTAHCAALHRFAVADTRHSAPPQELARAFPRVAVATAAVAPDPEGVYAAFPHVAGYGRDVVQLNGTSKPKRVACRGSDGREYPQLVKGRDDARQDAAMEQVFELLNALFARKPRTRHVRVRTYRVVPLSTASGVIEWVEGTTTMHRIVVGDNEAAGLHAQQHPEEPRTTTLVAKLSEARKGGKPAALRKAFDAAAAAWTPVCHTHFEQAHGENPRVLHDAQENYVASCAVNAVVGYLLGIGDRHMQNILVDSTTGEVVHIDFGIALERGRLLPVPEVVPCRLTAEVVDGMGALGVDGRFRSVCEDVLRVVREGARFVIAVLEVVLINAPPRWVGAAGLGPEEQAREAESLLLRCKEKLSGVENGEVLSVEGQVGEIINQARDPDRLCKMYSGWAPFH